MRVAHAVLMARNEAVSVDPMNARGQLMYIRGTREIRSVFMRKGWTIDRTGNIEATCSAERGIKVIYQNSDSAADPKREPRAISGKGPAAVRMVEEGQMYFPEWEERRQRQREETRKLETAAAWFFCASVDGEEIIASCLARGRSRVTNSRASTSASSSSVRASGVDSTSPNSSPKDRTSM